MLVEVFVAVVFVKLGGRFVRAAAGDLDLAATPLRGERLGCGQEQFPDAFAAMVRPDHERGDASDPEIGVETGKDVDADHADDALGRFCDEHRIVRPAAYELQTAENKARVSGIAEFTEQVRNLRRIGVDGTADGWDTYHAGARSRGASGIRRGIDGRGG